jgi:hypothetical protein
MRSEIGEYGFDDDDDDDDDEVADSGSAGLTGAFLDMLIGYNSKGKNGKNNKPKERTEIINYYSSTPP